MFGIAWLTIPVLVGAISLLLGVLRLLYTAFWSRSARAEKIIAWVERGTVRLEAERDRLRAANTRIDAEPKKTGQDLVDDLNKKFGGDQ